MYKKILFYAEYSPDIGFGHVKRISNLINYFPSEQYQSKLVLKGKGEIDISFKQSIIFVKDYCDFLDEFKNFKPDLLVVDLIESENNKFFINFIRENRNDFQLLIIDNFFNSILKPDLVITPWGSQSKSNRALSGLEYLFFDKKSIALSQKKDKSRAIKNLLISMGGADNYAVTPLIVRAVSQCFPDKKLHVVIGPFFSKEIELDLYKIKSKNIFIYKGLSSLDDLFYLCDLAIIGGGQSKFEAALFGVPSLIIANTLQESRLSLDYAKLGWSIYVSEANHLDLGNLLESLNYFEARIGVFQSMSELSKIAIDGYGGYRILEYVEKKIFEVG